MVCGDSSCCVGFRLSVIGFWVVAELSLFHSVFICSGCRLHWLSRSVVFFRCCTFSHLCWVALGVFANVCVNFSSFQFVLDYVKLLWMCSLFSCCFWLFQMLQVVLTCCKLCFLFVEVVKCLEAVSR